MAEKEKYTNAPRKPEKSEEVKFPGQEIMENIANYLIGDKPNPVQKAMDKINTTFLGGSSRLKKDKD